MHVNLEKLLKIWNVGIFVLGLQNLIFFILLFKFILVMRILRASAGRCLCFLGEQMCSINTISRILS